MSSAPTSAEVNLLVIGAISAGGRAWDETLMADDGTGPCGVAWVEINPFGPGATLVDVLEGRRMGRFVQSDPDRAGFFRVWPEGFIQGPLVQTVQPQHAACEAFAAVLTEAGYTAAASSLTRTH